MKFDVSVPLTLSWRERLAIAFAALVYGRFTLRVENSRVVLNGEDL